MRDGAEPIRTVVLLITCDEEGIDLLPRWVIPLHPLCWGRGATQFFCRSVEAYPAHNPVSVTTATLFQQQKKQELLHRKPLKP